MPVRRRYGVSEVQLNKLLQKKGFCSVRVRIRSIHRSEAIFLGVHRASVLIGTAAVNRSAGSILFDRRRWLDPKAAKDRPLLLQVGLRNEPYI